MKQKTINLYQFNELTDEQKEKVLDKYRDWNDYIFDSYVYDECNTLELHENGFLNPTIHYDLNYCQGDGACFDCDEFDIDLLLKDWQHPHKNWIIDVIKSHYQGHIKTNNFSYHYCHSKTRFFELDTDLAYFYRHLENAIYSAENYIENLRYELSENLTARLYDQLEWLRSDEQIAESLIANEYYFNGETLEIEN